MYTIIGGFDYTDDVPYDSIAFTLSQNDPQPQANLDVLDIGSVLSFVVGQEVIIWDENAAPTYASGYPVPTVPAHNILIGFDNHGTYWLSAGTLSGRITPGTSYTLSFSNNALGSGSYYQVAPAGYVFPGQQYMFSLYLTISTPMTSCNAFIQMDFLDDSSNIIGGSTQTLTVTSTLSNQLQRLNVYGVAPSGAVTIKCSFGGNTTVNGTNSGTCVFGSPQCEPMWFTNLERGVSYPTPDCNYAQVNSAQMPDGTFSRTCRIFSGTIDDWQIDYDGTNRTWHLSIAGPGAQLENGLINQTFTAYYDDQIIASAINTYFAGLLSISAANNSAPAPVQRGALIDSITYNDNSMRDLLNSLSEQSGFVYQVNMYYAVQYNAAYYNAAPWALTSGTPDNIGSFNCYDFQLESDGTQRKRSIKVVGGKFVAGAITDLFSGDGTTKTFLPLSQQPYNVQSVTVGGTAQMAGVDGVDTLGVNGIVVLVHKTLQKLTFHTAPASGANNIACTYTYEKPVAVQVDSVDFPDPVVPAYAQPLYQSKVTDTALTSITAATQRGLAEVTRSSRPKGILGCKAAMFAAPGVMVFITDTQSGINNQPYTVQSVKGSCLGNGKNQYEYQFGPYVPSLIDHVRNANKASNRSQTTANVTTPVQIDVVAIETLQYSDSVSATALAGYAVGVYGNASSKYGSCSYGGATGLYGTAFYGLSTIYG